MQLRKIKKKVSTLDIYLWGILRTNLNGNIVCDLISDFT